MQVGEALRRIHESGGAHGGLTPSAVILTSAGVHLLEAESGNAEQLRAYLAPERLQGEAADACADIYSFGAVVYEMVTGCRAFHDDGTRTPRSMGHPNLDRIVNTCLCSDPAGRFQRIQHAVMELKLVAGSERRSERGAVLRRSHVEELLRTEMQHLELRWSTLFEQHQRDATEGRAVLREACELLHGVRSRVAELEGRLVALEERVTRSEDGGRERQGEIAEQQAVVLNRLHELQQTVDAQTVAVEANTKGLARTDDLVERVVEALESLQILVLDQSQDHLQVDERLNGTAP